MPAQSAYVTGYEHDVFVSYAHVDNKPLTGESTGWVDVLHNDLSTRLAQVIGRTHWGRIWIDHLRIDPTQPFPAEIETAVRRTATLLTVLSTGWQSSDWCNTELQLFTQACGGDGEVRGRIFVVRRDRIDPERQPTQLRKLNGFDFCREVDGERIPIALPPVRGSDDWDAYYAILWKLARRLRERMESLKAAAGIALVPAAVPVYVGESPAALHEQEAQVIGQLNQAQIRWRSGESQPAERPVIEIRLGGDDPSSPRLRWALPGEIDPGDATLYEQGPLILGPLTELLRAVEDWALRHGQAPAPALEAAEFVILGHPEDRALAEYLREQLTMPCELRCNLLLEEDPSWERIKTLDSLRGLLIVYGRGGADWTQAQIAACRGLSLSRRDLICAVLDEPGRDKPSLGHYPPRFHRLDAISGSAFARFVAALCPILAP